MDDDSFYAVTLDEKNPNAKCELHEDLDQRVYIQKLVIKQICLGADAKEGEYNVVQVETRINDKEPIKIPIAVLKAGETRLLRAQHEFPKYPVTFKLIEGSGPVHIYGQQLIFGIEGGEEEWDEDSCVLDREHFMAMNGY